MNQSHFCNRLIEQQPTETERERLARGHDGIIKVVVDIAHNRMAGGAKWHSESLELLTNAGSSPGDCWGAKYDIHTGNVVYESQINKDRPENRTAVIGDQAIREAVLRVINRYLE